MGKASKRPCHVPGNTLTSFGSLKMSLYNILLSSGDGDGDMDL